MTSATVTPPTYTSPYQQRIRLVADALRANSELDEATATELARHALSALDHIPEKLR